MARLRSYLLLTLFLGVLATWATAIDSGRVFDTWGFLKDTETDTGNTITADTLGAPSALTATPSGTSQINLQWTATNDAYATHYQIFRCAGPACSPITQLVQITEGTAGCNVAPSPLCTYGDTNSISPGTTYCYKVRTAYVISGTPVWTSGFSNTTSPCATIVAANLTVDQSDAPDPDHNYADGAVALTYTVTITNNGAAATTANFASVGGQPILIEHLPAGVTFSSVSTNSGTLTCSSIADGGHTDVRCFDSDGLANGASHTVTIHVNVPDTICGENAITALAVVDPSNVQAETDESVADNQEPESTSVWCADLDLAQYDDPDAAPSFAGSQNDAVDVPSGVSGGAYTSYDVFVLHNDGVIAIGAMSFGGAISGTANKSTVTITAIGGVGWSCTASLATATTGSWSCSGGLARDDNAGSNGGADEVAIIVKVQGTGTVGLTITYNGSEAVCTNPLPVTGQTNSCRDGVYDPANASGSSSPTGTNPPQAMDTLN